MRRILVLLLCVCLCCAAALPAGASEEASPLTLEYALRIDGAPEGEAKPGDVVTVVFSVRRSDGGSGGYALRILQNEIVWDEDFFLYVPGSAEAMKGGNALYQTRTDGTHIVKASYLSPGGGSFRESEDFCSFRLRVVGTEGSGWVRSDPDCSKAYDGDNLRVTIREAADTRVTAAGSWFAFTDVKETAWYRKAVEYVWLRGFMNGMGGDRFEPDTLTSRAMVVTVLHRMEGCPDAGDSGFTDVKPGKWYSDAVAWASAKGIVLGYGNGCFGPEDNVTREQLAAILQRYRSFSGQDVSRRAELTGYEDASSVSAWAREAVEWAVAVGLLEGRTETSLAPGGYATRAEVATLLMRYDRLGR